MCWQCGAWDKLKVERHSVFEFLFNTGKSMTNNFEGIFFVSIYSIWVAFLQSYMETPVANRIKREDDVI